MLGAFVRHLRSAQAAVTLELYVVDSKASFDRRTAAPVLAQRLSGLQVRRLAKQAEQDLLNRVSASERLLWPGTTFDDVGWKFAANRIQQVQVDLALAGAEGLPHVVPYLCFLAQHMEVAFVDGEVRSVGIARSGQVWVEREAGGKAQNTNLGSFRS